MKSFLFKCISDTTQPFLHSLVKTSLLAILFGLITTYSVDLIFPNYPHPNIEFSIHNFIGAVLLGPIFESLFMLPIFIVIKKITDKILLAAVLSASFWAGLHSLQYIFWGVVTFPLFFIISLSYLSWIKKSQAKAVLSMLLIHHFNNTFMYSLAYFTTT